MVTESAGAAAPAAVGCLVLLDRADGLDAEFRPRARIRPDSAAGAGQVIAAELQGRHTTDTGRPRAELPLLIA